SQQPAPGMDRGEHVRRDALRRVDAAQIDGTGFATGVEAQHLSLGPVGKFAGGYSVVRADGEDGIARGREREKLPARGWLPNAQETAPVVAHQSVAGTVEGASHPERLMPLERPEQLTGRHIPKADAAVITAGGQGSSAGMPGKVRHRERL